MPAIYAGADNAAQALELLNKIKDYFILCA